MRVTVDEAGRVQLPDEARERLGLHPGSEVDIRVEGDSLEITPAEGCAYLEREGNRWVIVTPESAGTVTAEMTDAILEELRGPARSTAANS